MTGVRQKRLFPRTEAGFTLMEVIVSVALFSVIILTATGIFKLVIDAQRKEIATQNVEESLKYFLEVLAKEIRTAQKSVGGSCGVPDGEIFTVGANSLGDVLSFQNFYEECVVYSLEADAVSAGRFKIQRDSDRGFISPAKIVIDSLNFYLTSGTSTQPTVTINLSAQAASGPSSYTAVTALTIQTSATSRLYKE